MALVRRPTAEFELTFKGDVSRYMEHEADMDPLDDPSVRDKIAFEQQSAAHEKRMRELSEQRHEQVIKQQILGLKLQKVAAEHEKSLIEEEARLRMNNLYYLNAMREGYAQGQESLRPHRRSRSHSVSGKPAYHDEASRARHVCSRCHHRGHYSRECNAIPYPVEARGRMTRRAGSRAGSRSRSRAGSRMGSRAGSTYGDYEEDDEDWEYDEEVWYSEDDEEHHYYYDERPRKVKGVPSDQGVLVVYTPGGGPGTVRYKSSVRTVIGS